MIYRSNAKINLSLQITGVRKDGYHDLDMVELPIALHDVLEINLGSPSGDSLVTCDEIRLAKFKDNLCKKALDLMAEEYKLTQPISIFIHKVIPFAAGLGGGSSNTASTLKAINELLHLNVETEELKRIGLKLGSDVPFFFDKKPSRVKGQGEILEPIKVGGRFYVVLIKPDKGCSTREIYSICDKFPKKAINNDLVLKGLEEGNEDLIAENIGNDLMDPAMSINEEIAPTIELLKSFDFKIVSMSGSGSCCFAMSKDKRKCYTVYKKLLKQGYNVYISKILE